MIIGTLASALFMLVITNLVIDGFTYGHFEYDVIGKLSCLVGIGILFIIFGSVLLKKKPQKDTTSQQTNEYYLKRDNQVFVKVGGNFTVSPKKIVRILAVFMLVFWCFLMIGFFIILWKTTHSIDWSIFFLYIGILIFFIYISCQLWGPTISVEGDIITVTQYIWKKEAFPFSHITYRRVENADPNFFTIFSNHHRISRYKITYCHELRELMSITTDLENAVRFDVNVLHYMNKKNESQQ